MTGATPAGMLVAVQVPDSSDSLAPTGSARPRALPREAWLWVALAAFSAAGYVALRVFGLREVALPLKAGPVLALAVGVRRLGRSDIRRSIALGLVWSAAGDVFLEVEGRFLMGVGAFAAAHVAYLVAFQRSPEGSRLEPLRLVPFVAWSVPLLAVCAPALGALALPVVAYGTLLTAMMWRAVARVRPGDGMLSGSVLVACGAVVFGVSDSCILVALAGYGGGWSEPTILVTYWSAQLAIALGAMRT